MAGKIEMYGGSSAPSGFQLCDGASYDTTAKAALFAVIGYTYGGSGANFNVPDLRGRIAVGAGAGPSLTSRALGDQSGQEAITSVAAHKHNVNCQSGAPNGDTPVSSFFGVSEAGSKYYRTNTNASMATGIIQ